MFVRNKCGGGAETPIAEIWALVTAALFTPEVAGPALIVYDNRTGDTKAAICGEKTFIVPSVGPWDGSVRGVRIARSKGFDPVFYCPRKGNTHGPPEYGLTFDADERHFETRHGTRLQAAEVAALLHGYVIFGLCAASDPNGAVRTAYEAAQSHGIANATPIAVAPHTCCEPIAAAVGQGTEDTANVELLVIRQAGVSRNSVDKGDEAVQAAAITTQYKPKPYCVVVDPTTNLVGIGKLRRDAAHAHRHTVAAEYGRQMS